ncbi:MAG: hemerythrin domain-containing protein [Planctomycetota bacterium]
MRPEDLTRWLSTERARVEELAFLVRKQLAVPPPGSRARWLPEARECFRRLADHLKKHMALEETDGYLREVRERRPALSDEVDRLQHEHAELERLMGHIQHEMDELRPEDNLLIRCCCARIGMLLSYVERHEEQENQLVLHVFCQDLGGDN